MNLYRVAWGYFPLDPRNAQEHLVLAKGKAQCKRWAMQTFNTMPDVVDKYDQDDLRLPRKIYFMT